jgi:integrase
MKRRWLGGYVHTEKDGRPLFIIERQVKGHRFHVSTRCNTERAALKQLERFEGDPLGYRPEGGDGGDAILLTEELILEFAKWSITTRGNTRRYAQETSAMLLTWARALHGLDLRRVTLRDHIVPALDNWGGKAHRIIAIKSLYAWLRRVRHALTSAQDPTLDLPVPQAQPAKNKRRKAVEWARVEAAYKHLVGPYRDVLHVLSATGWHTTELGRFIRSETSSIDVPPTPVFDRHGRQVLAVLGTLHKTGKRTRTPLVERAHVDAARRLRERGSVPRKLNEAVASACSAAGVKPFTLGVMRHSVATWAIELGASAPDAAEYLGHESKKTLLRFYADVAFPTVTIPTRVLGD